MKSATGQMIEALLANPIAPRDYIAGERNDALRVLGYSTDSPGMEAWRTLLFNMLEGIEKQKPEHKYQFLS